MEMCSIGPELVLFGWKEGELEEDFSLRHLLMLVCEGCLRAGWKPERMEELEAWTVPEGILALIRLSRRRKEWFRFSALTEALDAALGLPEAPCGLMEYEGWWLLGVERESCCAVSEYADPLTDLETEELAGLGTQILNREGMLRLRQECSRIEKQT